MYKLPISESDSELHGIKQRSGVDAVTMVRDSVRTVEGSIKWAHCLWIWALLSYTNYGYKAIM